MIFEPHPVSAIIFVVRIQNEHTHLAHIKHAPQDYLEEVALSPARCRGYQDMMSDALASIEIHINIKHLRAAAHFSDVDGILRRS